MRRVLYFLLILVIVGCGNKQSQATQQNNIVEVGLDSTKLTTKDFKNLSYRDYVLDKSAKYKVSGWAKYNEVNDIITEVKNANLSYFKNDKKEGKQYDFHPNGNIKSITNYKNGVQID